GIETAGLSDYVLPRPAHGLGCREPLGVRADALLPRVGGEQTEAVAAVAELPAIASREVERLRPERLPVLLGRRHRQDVAARIVRLGQRGRTELDQIAVVWVFVVEALKNRVAEVVFVCGVITRGRIGDAALDVRLDVIDCEFQT